MSTTAVIAALPRELAPLAHALHAVPVSSRAGVQVQRVQHTGIPKGEVLLVTGGMGAARVSLAVSAALETAPVSTLISAGLVGACDPRLVAGEPLQAALVVDSRTGERFSPQGSLLLEDVASLVLATSPAIAGVSEKHRLHDTYGAAAVDMEAAAVARIARAHSLPFAAIKSISDSAEEDLSHLAAFAGPQGEFRAGAFAFHTLLHPTQWTAAARLGRNSKSALNALTATLQKLLSQATPTAK